MAENIVRICGYLHGCILFVVSSFE
jgi:hypothetical protein